MGEPVFMLRVPVERLPHAADLPLPAYATADAAGLDLMAAIADDEPLHLAPRQWQAVATGLRIALPSGYEAQVRPRSGLAMRHGITVLNAPGTIDADYRGEIKVLLINLGDEPVSLVRGERIAQLVVAPVVRLAWSEEPIDVEGTTRGAGGFGSTGRQGGTAGATKG